MNLQSASVASIPRLQMKDQQCRKSPERNLDGWPCCRGCRAQSRTYATLVCLPGRERHSPMCSLRVPLRLLELQLRMLECLYQGSSRSPIWKPLVELALSPRILLVHIRLPATVLDDP